LLEQPSSVVHVAGTGVGTPKATNSCRSVAVEEGQLDDHLAFFSNDGQTVDISARGVRVTSTHLNSWARMLDGHQLLVPDVR
jgi:hypothetical protein